ncbi:MAG: flagellar basal body-associated FliL family protein [Lachnospiraceae bacterium]|nr:flagellar basal body-associated FliL family protein [Lachnospiraceae bacterium]
MKRNLILVIICMLCLVNVVLTAVMMISTMNANKKTTTLINEISAVLDLELDPNAFLPNTGPSLTETENVTVDGGATMTIPLAPGADDKAHYAVVAVTLSLDTTAEDYAEKRPLLDQNMDRVKSEIINAVGAFNMEEMLAEQSGNWKSVRDAILVKLQDLFGSKFIYEVVFPEGVKAQ